jgi:hypothetical protein
MKTTLILIIIFQSILSFSQNDSLCNLNIIEDVRKVNIDITLFHKKDTTVTIKDRNGKIYIQYQFNVIFECENGTVILGNVDDQGLKNGRWTFERIDANGFEGRIVGNYKKDKMDGYWQHGPYSSLYKKGKHKKTTKLPF